MFFFIQSGLKHEQNIGKEGVPMLCGGVGVIGQNDTTIIICETLQYHGRMTPRKQKGLSDRLMRVFIDLSVFQR